CGLVDLLADELDMDFGFPSGKRQCRVARQPAAHREVLVETRLCERVRIGLAMAVVDDGLLGLDARHCADHTGSNDPDQQNRHRNREPVTLRIKTHHWTAPSPPDYGRRQRSSSASYGSPGRPAASG